MFFVQSGLHDRIQLILLSQRGHAAEEASDRSDDVGPTLGCRRTLRLRLAASVRPPVHVRRLSRRRLVASTAVRSANQRPAQEAQHRQRGHAAAE